MEEGARLTASTMSASTSLDKGSVLWPRAVSAYHSLLEFHEVLPDFIVLSERVDVSRRRGPSALISGNLSRSKDPVAQRWRSVVTRSWPNKTEPIQPLVVAIKYNK